jgi:hypothetical protein
VAYPSFDFRRIRLSASPQIYSAATVANLSSFAKTLQLEDLQVVDSQVEGVEEASKEAWMNPIREEVVEKPWCVVCG